jgi:hypothetical protein
LTADAWLSSQARLKILGVFSRERLELKPAGETFDATLHAVERNGWGDSKLEGALALLSGLPYATVYPEIYNIDHRAMNFTSLLRWDPEKRRAFGAFSTPAFDNPSRRFQIYFDARNENWNLTSTFFGSTPLGDLNLRRVAGGLELHSVVNGRWSWSTGTEVASRSFRNLQGLNSPAEKASFTDANSFTYWLRADRSLWRVPERRFTLDSSAEGRMAAHSRKISEPPAPSAAHSTRTGCPAPRVTTTKCALAFARAPHWAACHSMISSSLAWNATTTFGFAATPAQPVVARAPRPSAAATSSQTGRWIKTFTATASSP